MEPDGRCSAVNKPETVPAFHDALTVETVPERVAPPATRNPATPDGHW